MLTKCSIPRYFHYYENMIEWAVLILVLISLLPDKWFYRDKYLQKHLAAFTFLLAFMQVRSSLIILQISLQIFPRFYNIFLKFLMYSRGNDKACRRYNKKWVIFRKAKKPVLRIRAIFFRIRIRIRGSSFENTDPDPDPT